MKLDHQGCASNICFPRLILIWQGKPLPRLGSGVIDLSQMSDSDEFMPGSNVDDDDVSEADEVMTRRAGVKAERERGTLAL